MGYELAVSVLNHSNSCLVATTFTEQQIQVFGSGNAGVELICQIQAFGVSAVMCLLLFLIPTLVLEVYYICANKSNFLLRSFLYMTVAANIMDGAYAASYLSLKSENVGVIYKVCTGLTHYAILVEVSIVLAINLTLVSNLYKYILSDRGLKKHIFIWCANLKCSKRNEVIIILLIFIIPLPTILGIEIALEDLKTREHFVYAVFAVFYLLLLFDLVLSIACAMILISWFWSLKRLNLLKSKRDVVCREISLVVWLVVFVTIWSISAPLEFINFKLDYENLFVLYMHFPIVQALIPIAFFVYMCVTIGRPKKKVTLRIPDKRVTLRDRLRTARLQTTPSSGKRVSLPSDTGARALNFLSPSTAGPTYHCRTFRFKHVGVI